MLNTTNGDVQKVINKLKRLPKSYQSKVLKKIFKRNAKVVVRAARQNVPVAAKPITRNGRTFKPGTLKRAINSRTSRKITAVYVSPKISKKGEKQQAWYDFIMERGKAGMQGYHYLEKAYHSTKNTVVNGIIIDAKAVLKNYIRTNKIR